MELTDILLDNGVSKILLSGRLDMKGTGEIEIPFTNRTTTGNVPVIVDMSGVMFISSIGIRLLLTCAKGAAARGKKFILFGLTREVYDTIVLPGLDQVLAIAGDEAVAIKQALVS